VKIAIIGSGIAGNVAGYHLHRQHDITVFEAASHVGGHTHTHSVEQAGQTYRVDTGFIVFNDRTYPNFVALLAELRVASRESVMSFSVMDEASGLEYNGMTLNTLFAQRRNLFRPSFLGMVRDILRFNREAPRLLDEPGEELTLGDYLQRGRYGRAFIDHYIIPMGAAIWSTDPHSMLSFPARFFIRFFHHHGMLSVNDRPVWRTIDGGSARYVERLTAGFRQRIRLNTPVEWVRRQPGSVIIKSRGHEPERFDALFMACHSDQALTLLADASALERSVLGAIPYQVNEAVLHTDSRLLPRTPLANAAWNYHLAATDARRVALTYNMNILQGINAPVPFLVTLNRSEVIDPATILKRITYHHPLYGPESVLAQARHRDINGPQRTYFCGAWCQNGFHEDGVVSALAAVGHLREDHEQRAVYRTA
jgi:uncharacterized protein